MNRNEARSAAILLILTVFVIEEHSSPQKAQKAHTKNLIVAAVLLCDFSAFCGEVLS